MADLPQKASAVVNQFMQAIAVMIVTSCIIPLLVLAVFLWSIQKISKHPMPPMHHPRHLPSGSREQEVPSR